MSNGSANPLKVEITFDPNANPQWTVNPPSLPVPPGNSPIIWQLMNSQTTFPNSNGIVFPVPSSGSKNAIQWPGTTPVFQNQHMYFATDVNNLVKDDPPEVFQYEINILFNNSAVPTFDPDVTNEPPSGGGGDEEDFRGNNRQARSGD